MCADVAGRIGRLDATDDRLDDLCDQLLSELCASNLEPADALGT